MTDKVHMAAMARSELRDSLSELSVILVPMGSIEDQGPLTFMGDYLCAQRLAELIAARANAAGTRTIIAPTLPFGCWDCFAGGIGSITLRPEIFRGVVDNILGALIHSGAENMLIINGHSGNNGPIFEVTNAIYSRSGLIIPSLYIWRAAYQLWEASVGTERASRSAGHGANPLGSVAMHMFPTLVRPDSASPPVQRGSVIGLPVTGLASVRFDAVDVDIPLGINETSADGATGGDMRECSAELGGWITDALAKLGADLVQHLAADTR